MPHPNRSRHKANQMNRHVMATRQKPLPPAEQARRAAANRAAKLHRYPVPPKYRPAHDAACPDQPLCYAMRA